MAPNSARLPAVAAPLALEAALLGAGAWREHALGGIELVLIALAAVLAGPTSARLLALRGRTDPAPRAFLALELLAFTGLLVYPCGTWALLAGGLAALLHALPFRRVAGSPPSSFGDEAPSALLAILALLAGIRSRAALPLLLTLVATGTYRVRTVALAARRAQVFALVLGAALLEGYSQDGRGMLLLLAALATVATFLAMAPSPRESWKSFALLATNSCVLFGLVNVGASGALSILEALRHEREAAAVVQAQASYDPDPRFQGADLAELTAETWKPLRFEPFTLFRERERQGRFVNVDPRGFRAVKDQGPWPPEKTRFNVFVFGGSTTFGYGVADDDTIPSHLQETLAHVHSGVCVYNFGRGYYYSVQERILFEQLLLSGAVPDVAVFLDGLNDFQLDSVPAMTAQLDASTERAARPEAESLLGDLTRRLPVVELVAALRARSAPQPEPEDERVVASILERYRANKRLIELTASGFGVRPLFVFQPVPTYHFSGPLHPLAAAGLAAHERSRRGYPAVASVRGTLGSDFLWLGDMQEGMTGTLYVDAVHYSGPMGAAIARKIADELARGLDK
jgi:hypothetical protein